MGATESGKGEKTDCQTWGMRVTQTCESLRLYPCKNFSPWQPPGLSKDWLYSMVSSEAQGCRGRLPQRELELTSQLPSFPTEPSVLSEWQEVVSQISGGSGFLGSVQLPAWVSLMSTHLPPGCSAPAVPHMSVLPWLLDTLPYNWPDCCILLLSPAQRTFCLSLLDCQLPFAFLSELGARLHTLRICI